MNKLISLITPGIDLVKTNLTEIIVALASVITIYIAYKLTSYSLKRLTPEIISYYPFDKFFPKSGKWSVFYFLITIFFLVVLVYVIVKGEFYLAPA